METIGNKDMPAPDQIVQYSDGMFGPAMFHYTPEVFEAAAIAVDALRNGQRCRLEA